MSKQTTSSKSETDWQKLDEMTDAEIDFTDCPEITPEQFAKAIVRKGLPITGDQVQVNLSIDRDVWEWLQSQEGYQREMNRLLREYMETNN